MDPRVNGTNDEKRELIRETLKYVQGGAPGAKYGSMKRLLARLAFEAGDEEEGIDSLIESHSILARHRILFKEVFCGRTNPDNRKTIDSKYVDFYGEYSNGYSSVMKRLREMPEEWTVVQLTCTTDPTWRFGGPGVATWTPVLHVLRMECGPAAGRPVYVELPVPPEASNFPVIVRLHKFIVDNKVDTKKVTRREYWQNRKAVDDALQEVIDFTADWLLPLSPLFTGHLVDTALTASLHCAVDKAVVNSCPGWKQLSQTGHCLLYKTAENLLLLEADKLPHILAKALNVGVNTPCVKELASDFKTMRTKFADQLSRVKRHPVILLLDETLDLLPLELLPVLKQQPVSRAPSLHLLHGLFKVHEDCVRHGLKEVDGEDGFCVINPDGSLENMQERMTQFMAQRCTWPQLVGQLPQEQHVEQALGSDAFVYLGHGGGAQFWNVDKFGRGVRATVMLFGCRSAGLKPKTACIEADMGFVQYLNAACPCLVGFLWNVTDKDADRFAQAVLAGCLAGTEMLQAVAEARLVPDMLVNRAAPVVRGLPTMFRPSSTTCQPPQTPTLQEQERPTTQTRTGARPKRKVPTAKRGDKAS